MEKNGVLMVEGRDDVAVISALARIYDIPETFCLKDVVGIDKLLDEFFVVLTMARLKEYNFDIKRLGILVDANSDISTRWKDIKQILTDKEYTVDENPHSDGTILRDESKEIPVIGIWIMPDNIHSGILEDFFQMFIPDNDVLLPYVNHCIDRMEKDPAFENPEPRSKAETRTWLAWQKKSESRMGYFISENKDSLHIHNDYAEKFVTWIRNLFTT